MILFSCTKEDNTKTDETAISEYKGMTIIEEVGMKNVFSSKIIQEITTNKYDIYSMNYYDRIFYLDDKVYLTAKKFHDDEDFKSSDIIIHSFDMIDGSEESIVIKSFDEDAYINFMWYDSEYNIITIEELNYEYTLYKSTASHETLYSVPLNINDTIISMALGENDNIYIGTEKNVTVYSNDGKYVTSIPLSDKLIYISSAHGKKPITKMKNNIYSKPIYKYIDIDTNSLEDIEMESEINLNYYDSHIIYGDGYDYYHVTNTGIYGYDITSNTLTKTLDWSNSDLSFADVYALSCISFDKVFMFSLEYLTEYFTILTHIPNDELPEKTYISIGYIDGTDDSYLTSAVQNFNKRDDEYRITLTNYYSPYSELDPVLRLNNDIASGNSPDMLYMNNNLSLTTYSVNGMFVDLYKYLNDDEELYNNLLPLASESAALNGKLYQMITDFWVVSLVGKAETFDGKSRWSYRDAISIYNEIPSGVIMEYSFTREFFADLYLPDAISEYVDYATGTCSFDTQGFKELLEFIKLLPKERNQEDQQGYIELYNKYIYSKCRSGEMLLSKVFIADAMSYETEKVLSFRDDETVMIGYPTSDGSISGDIITARGFSILSSSNNKDTAWEFIKYCLSDEFRQISIISSGYITPTKSAIQYYNDAMSNDYVYIDDASLSTTISEKEKDFESEYGNGILVKIDDDVLSEYVEYLESLVYKHKDTTIKDIVNDELNSFLNTDKSTEDTANAIQSRVSIYMSEMWE